MTMEPRVTTAVAERPEHQIERISEVAIEAIQHNIKMAEKLVQNVLEKGIDYGTTPGITKDGLWDPGAAKIMAAFNAHAQYKVLHHEEGENIISWCLECNIISRSTGSILGSGVGACSTREVKYKYRWEKYPQDYGYTPEQIKTFKVKDGRYRMPNPEYGELTNTLFQMAAKRSDCDAAKSLPGVGGALRKLFESKEHDWPAFWSTVANMGYTEEEAHKALNVKSMKNWLATGKTLEQAVHVLGLALKARKTDAESKSRQVAKKDAKTAPATESVPDELNPSDIPDYNTLLKVAHQRWGIQPTKVWAELGVDGKAGMTTPAWESYLQLKAIFEPKIDNGAHHDTESEDEAAEIATDELPF